jgi:phosphoribosylformimino-5-aminoimidazole carboxamide ribotide isomerase
MRPVILIPVIDLKNGVVVHARAGERSSYRPIRSTLCDSHDPAEVIGALLRLHPFKSIYAADLDRIAGTGNNDAALDSIRTRHPDIELWVDAGIGTRAVLREWGAKGLGLPVVGSESLESFAEWRKIREDADVVLSLDFKGARFLGPAPLSRLGNTWPSRVLVMDLIHVGTGRGPNFPRIAEIRHRAVASQVFAAGGVRGVLDLKCLAAIGATGALVASALHDGRLGRSQLARFTRNAQSRGR